MADITFVTPKAGSGGVNLFSRRVVDGTTQVGSLPDGMRLELEQDSPDWRACRVFVSTLFAEAQGDQFVQLKAGAEMSNIRQAPVLGDATDVGDLNPGQQLELIQLVGNWWMARVYVSTQSTDTGTGDLNVGVRGDGGGGSASGPARQMDISTNGVDFIKQFEGVSLVLYNDPVGHCTVGYGHLVHIGNCDGRDSERAFTPSITQQQADALLKSDLAQYVAAVRSSVTVPLTQNQFDALVSFTYNLGVGALQDSDLLIFLNQGRYDTVPAQLNRFVHAGAAVLPGLVRRRQAEGDLFAK